MTKVQLINMVQNEPDFMKLVLYHTVRAAMNVTTEDGGAANHAARIILAPKILNNPQAWAQLFAYGVITNATIASRADTDAVLANADDIAFQVDSQFDSYAL